VVVPITLGAAALSSYISRWHAQMFAFWKGWKGALAGIAVLAVIGASFGIPKLAGGNGNETSATQGGRSMAGMSLGTGEGGALGSAPRFAERDVIGGKSISSDTLRGQRTLLFFSEGVMCQACLQQIRDIDDVGKEMSRRHIKLVSITPDSPDELRQAIGQYGIRSPMIADEDGTMSQAFNTLGKSMHPDTPGHAFALIDAGGKVVWQRDYYLPPYRTMYVEPSQLFKDIPSS